MTFYLVCVFKRSQFQECSLCSLATLWLQLQHTLLPFQKQQLASQRLMWPLPLQCLSTAPILPHASPRIPTAGTTPDCSATTPRSWVFHPSPPRHRCLKTPAARRHHPLVFLIADNWVGQELLLTNNISHHLMLGGGHNQVANRPHHPYLQPPPPFLNPRITQL